MTTPTRRIPLLGRFLLAVVLGGIVAATTWWAAHAVTAGWWITIITAAVILTGVAAVTWFSGIGAGLGLGVGGSFGMIPGFSAWAQDTTRGIWATWSIMVLGGMMLATIIVVVISHALVIARKGINPRDTADALNLPDSARVARRSQTKDDTATAAS